MAKATHSEEQMKSNRNTAFMIASSRMDDYEKYPQFFKKKFKVQLDWDLRRWEDFGILFLPTLNLYGEKRFDNLKNESFVPYNCVSLYIGFLFYGLILRFGIRYEKVENFKEEIEYNDDYWEYYDSYMDLMTKSKVIETPKKKAKKKEIKKDSAKFVNNKNTKSTKPKKNGKV
jgi:hypothetical protein